MDNEITILHGGVPVDIGSIWENWKKYNKKIFFNGGNFHFL
jgi:hypothetical protein